MSETVKKVAKKPATWGITISAGILFAALSWADTEHEKVEQRCEEMLELRCDQADELYSRKTDVAEIRESLKWVRDAVDENRALLKKIDEKIDRLK